MADSFEEIGANYSDSEKRVKWLREQVRPVVRRLLAVYDRTYLEQVLFDEFLPNSSPREEARSAPLQTIEVDQ